MSFYNIEVSLKIMNIIRVDPGKRDSRVQLFWYCVISLCLWFDLSLEVLLLIEKVGTFDQYIEIFHIITPSLYGILMMITIFVKRLAFYNLLKDFKEKFWKVEDINITELDEVHFTKTYTRMRIQFFALTALVLMWTLSFFLPVFMTKEKVLPFSQYQPSWMSIDQLIWLKMFVLVFALDLPGLATVSMLMTVIILTRIQYQLLIRVIENTLNTENDFSYDVIKKIVDHHNFLLRFNADINQAFSEFMLGFLATFSFSLCLCLYNLSVNPSVYTFMESIGVFGNLLGLIRLLFCYTSYLPVLRKRKATEIVIVPSLHVFMESMMTAAANIFCFMFFFFVPAQELSNEMDRFFDTVYFCHWYKHSQVKYFVLMVLTKRQKKVRLIAGRMVEINMETSLRIIRSIFSYCTFLRTISLSE